MIEKLIQYHQTRKRITFAIKVKAGAKNNQFGDVVLVEEIPYLKLSIKAPAEDGKAHKMIIDFLAKELAAPKSNLQIIKGQSSSYKVIEISDATEQDLERIRLFFSRQLFV